LKKDVPGTTRATQAEGRIPNGARPTPARLKLWLYVAGDAPNSIKAIANAKAICAEHFAAGQFEMSTFSIISHRARSSHTAALSTASSLPRFSSDSSRLPVRKVIGNLSDKSKVLLALSIT